LETVPRGMELVRGDAADFVAALKREEGGDIFLMGGGVLAASLIEAGLVDELAFSIHPVLLGGGTPTFGAMASRTEVELVECRAIAKGCVYVRYRLASVSEIGPPHRR
ncbi:MAG: dihydrofolate reductase family protein, partial [Thermoleophilaceae bacterium]